MAEPSEEKQLTEEEAFDAAFDEAFKEATEDTSEEEEKEDGKETSEAETDGKEKSKEEDIQKSEDIQEKETTQKPETEPSTYKELYESAQSEIQNLRDEISSLNQKMKSWEGRITKANERAKQAEEELEKTKTEKPSETKELDNVKEDDEAVKHFLDEFPDFKTPIMAIAKKVAKKIVEDELKDIKPSIEEVKTTVQESARERHYRSIQDAHPDWKEIYNSGKLKTWIDEQPAFMKNKLNEVITNGSSEEIIEMFDLYKKSHTPKEIVTNKQTQDKAKNIIAVKSSSGGPKIPKEENKDDFESGWNVSKARDGK